MALNSESTIEEMKAAWLDNASYEEEGSVEKAKKFITACRCLILKTPAKMAQGGSNATDIEMEVRLYSEQIDDARKFLAANSSCASAGITLLDATNFRS